MDCSQRIAGALWIAILTLVGGGLVGCSGSSSTSGGSPRLFDDLTRSRLQRYTPSDVSYETVYTPWDVDTAPTVDGGVRGLLRKLDYPESAREKRIRGKVWVGFIISPDGEPTHVEVVDSVHPTLDREALLTMKRANFTPGKMAGTPVPVKGVVPFTFRLRRASD
jgi:TonB family protein